MRARYSLALVTAVAALVGSSTLVRASTDINGVKSVVNNMTIGTTVSSNK
ncbi:MAG: hypothetical protein ACLPT4_15250 [Verrucomicrobiia bacterium]